MTAGNVKPLLRSGAGNLFPVSLALSVADSAPGPHGTALKLSAGKETAHEIHEANLFCTEEMT